MLFICYPKCSTCRKAQAWLEEKNIPYTLRDIKENQPTEQELRTWAAQSGLPLKRFFNTSGLLYKSLQLKDKLPAMTEDEQFLDYVFPILRYHSLFDELTREDLTYLFKVRDNTINGHLVNKTVKPVETLPVKRVLSDYRFGDICYEYLEKMAALCEEKGVELILIKAPSLYPYWYEEYDAQITEFAEAHSLAYYNFTTCVEQIGLDFSTDTYDAGLHLNLAGAVKMSRYFGDILAQKHGMEDHRNDTGIAELYDEKLRLYDLEVNK